MLVSSIAVTGASELSGSRYDTAREMELGLMASTERELKAERTLKPTDRLKSAVYLLSEAARAATKVCCRACCRMPHVCQMYATHNIVCVLQASMGAAYVHAHNSAPISLVLEKAQQFYSCTAPNMPTLLNSRYASYSERRDMLDVVGMLSGARWGLGRVEPERISACPTDMLLRCLRAQAIALSEVQPDHPLVQQRLGLVVGHDRVKHYANIDEWRQLWLHSSFAIGRGAVLAEGSVFRWLGGLSGWRKDYYVLWHGGMACWPSREKFVGGGEHEMKDLICTADIDTGGKWICACTHECTRVVPDSMLRLRCMNVVCPCLCTDHSAGHGPIACL